ncbi:MAG: hypothetical protein ACE5JX_14235 [Acidobacteriota bacterium]
MPCRFRPFFLFSAVLWTVLVASAKGGETPDLRGAWQPEHYHLKGGQEHRVEGLLFFSDRHWSVLFFVLGKGESPQRGSAEGGTYRLSGNQLVFTHLYHLSAGKAMSGLSASPLRMEVLATELASTEKCVIRLDGPQLTIFFPSGNRMTFRHGPGHY